MKRYSAEIGKLIAPHRVVTQVRAADDFFRTANYDTVEYTRSQLCRSLSSEVMKRAEMKRNREEETFAFQEGLGKVQVHEATVYVFSENELVEFVENLLGERGE